MKVVIQRVKGAELFVENKFYSKIGPGLLVLVAVSKDDKPEDINWMANKLVNLRIFNDDNNQMNRSNGVRVNPKRCKRISNFSVGFHIPIWLTLIKIEFAIPLSIPSFKIFSFVTKRSSPTNWHLAPD